MSSTRNASVKNLTSSLLPWSTTNNGVDSLMDKSSSLPDLANASNKASFADSSDNVNGFGNSGKAPNDLKKKTQRFLRSLRLKSLSKQQKFNHKLIASDEVRSKGTTNVHVPVTNPNEYDRFPGSDLEKNGRGPCNNCETVAGSSTSTAVSPTRVGKHQFSVSRIGYINPKKSGERSPGSSYDDTTVGLYDTADGDTRGNVPDQNSTSLDDPACFDCTENIAQDNLQDYYDVESVPSKELNDGLRTTHITQRSGSLKSVSSDSEIFPQDAPSVVNDHQKPPARPPKPLALRGKPLAVSETTSEDNIYEVPPRPPAREPTTHRRNAIRSIPLVNSCRLSGTYETINDSPPVVQVPECGLPGELRKLPHQPWYWGPLTQEQAESKLRGLPDGYFLVRDSSDDRYLLSLSFNSNGRPVHTRFEYIGGHFSINDSQGYTSVIDLIEEAVRESQNGVYSFMQNINGTQTFPARLTNPVSRFTEMKSLQHLCRFVIRETFPRHYVADLPVPEKIKKYILENQY